MLMLCLIPAIMSAIAVVREKETGSIANFRSTPITRFEFLIGKQLPYIAVAMISFFVLLLIAIFIFRVPLKGPFLVAARSERSSMSFATTGFGVLISSFTRTQVAAVFATAILSIVPAVNFSGMLAPVSSLSGGAKVLGLSFPSSWYQQISRRRLRQGARLSSTSGATSSRSRSSRSSSWPVAAPAAQAGGVRCRGSPHPHRASPKPSR